MRRWFVLAATCCALLACHGILGITDLEVVPDQDSNEPSGDDDPFVPSRDAGVKSTDDDDAGPPLVVPAGARTKMVFVTSGAWNAAEIGGIEGGNKKCNDVARSAGLSDAGATFVAWLSSDGKPAIDALTFDGPYLMLNDIPITLNKAGLMAGSIAAALNVQENGAKIGGGDLTGTWTGTHANGTVGGTCNNWTNASAFAFGTAADPKKRDGSWTDMGGQPLVSQTGWACSWKGRLYCFEQ